MKQLFLFLLLSIFLASCGTPAAPQLIVTFTLPPTLIPETTTLQPTNTPEPTATKDLMAGAPAEGDGVDNDGFYNDIDGIKYRQALDSNGEVLVDGWFRSGIENPMSNGGTYFMNEPKSNFDPLFSLEVYINNDIVNAPQLISDQTDAKSTESAFTSDFMIRLMEKYYGKTQSQLLAKGDFPSQVGQFKADLYASKISLEVSDSNGNIGILTNRTQFKVFLVNKDTFAPDQQSQDEQSKTFFEYDSQRNITRISVLVASKTTIDFSTLPDIYFISMILRPIYKMVSLNDRSSSDLVRRTTAEPNPLFIVKHDTN